MNITQLTVVNACLASMGEEPINSLADENAFVNSAKFALEQANINEQTRGWYFNLETITLHPHAVTTSTTYPPPYWKKPWPSGCPSRNVPS